VVVANMQDATQPDDEDCTITGVETQHGPAYNIDGEPLFKDVLLAATHDPLVENMPSVPVGADLQPRLRNRD
jgi:hypothetical protein